MRTSSKLILAALTAALVLAVTVGTASARNGLTASPSETTATFGELSFGAGTGVEAVCEVSLIVTLHASIPKSVGTLAGFTRIRINSCSKGTATLLQEPNTRYHVLFGGFTGTLPNIQSVTLAPEEVEFLIEPGFLGVSCLATETIQGVTEGNPVRALITNQRVNGITGFLCPEEAQIVGTATVSPAVTITLV